MGRLEGSNSARVIRKRQRPHVIIRESRGTGTYVDGIYVDGEELERSSVLMYTQPVNKNLEQGNIGERSMQSRNGWATIDQDIKVRDKVEIGDSVFTISNIQEWESLFRSFDLTRTGERQNLAEGAEDAIL